MPIILHVNASPRGSRSSSLQLAHLFLGSVREAAGQDLEVETLNLFDDGALPGFGSTAAAAKMAVFAGQEQSPAQAAAWRSARGVFEQFAAADSYVFNIPMWNAGVPYVLKQWIDLVTQPDWSFGFHPESGYTGLMTGKQAVAVHTSGVYAPGFPPAFGQDFSSTFFADWLQFVGITDATHVRFAPTVVGADVEAARRQAEDGLQEAAEVFASRLIRPDILQPVSG
jgi:FMN-dependent NADH-azoreductase